MKTWILVDLDHTVSDARWRDGMIGTASWDEYHETGREDKPVEALCALLAALKPATPDCAFNLMGVTMRPEKWRQQTMEWLVENEVMLDELLMRPDNSYAPSPVAKVEAVTTYFGSLEAVKDSVLMVFDDRDDVCQAFRALGITTLQVSIGDNQQC